MGSRASWVIGIVMAAALGMGPTAWAQDPVEVGPHIYKVQFENARVRVSEITFKPGDSIAMHSHPDHFVYVLTGGTLTLSYPDGHSAPFVGTPGQVAWIAAESHAAVNTGTTEFRGLVVELKP
jgi:quercetin dioxygenase-like cupin family protein